MKKIILIILAIAISGFIVYSQNNKTAITPSPTPSTTGFFPTPQDAKNRIEVVYGNETYNIFYSPVNNNSIELIPNFTQKVSSKDLIKENKCRAAVNGGFYTTENTPLGLFVANGKQYASEIINDRNLLTGFFSVDNVGKPSIKSVSSQNNNLIIQTGPLLYKDVPFNASIDENARRSLIGQDSENIYYFLMITLKDDIYSGPLLSDLPNIVFSVNNPFSLNMAINLDGGSASTFYEDGFHIAELSSIGSLICIH